MLDGPLTGWSACSKCEKRIRVNFSTSRPNPVCRSCRKANPEPYGPRSGIPWVTKFTCVVCGTEFERLRELLRPKKPPQVCSQTCTSRLARQARATHTNQTRRIPCIGCSAEVTTTGAKALCPDCRETRKREHWRAANRRRRARLRNAVSEPYTLAEIAERDQHCCQLCRQPVAMGLKSPDPMSPSIDHVIPLSRGGNDTRTNVQLSHRICNTRKGARSTH